MEREIVVREVLTVGEVHYVLCGANLSSFVLERAVKEGRLLL